LRREHLSLFKRLLFFNMENLIPRAKSDFNGFAGEDCEVLWRFQVSVFFSFLTPDTRHLKPKDLVLGNRGPARRVGCPKDQFDI
jgi:hypothetical protein